MKTVILSLVLTLLPAAVHAELWGSAKSGTYHIASCRYVKKIAKEYRIKFDSATAARDAGYKPCEVCKPPKTASATLPPAKAPEGGKAGPARKADR